jgi:Zn-dependent peptidase ImmA (M78 family)
VPKFDGITLVTDKGQPILFVNDSLPNDRKIFSIAHELGHLIMHIPISPLPDGIDEEKETNEFSGEFFNALFRLSK